MQYICRCSSTALYPAVSRYRRRSDRIGRSIFLISRRLSQMKISSGVKLSGTVSCQLQKYILFHHFLNWWWKFCCLWTYFLTPRRLSQLKKFLRVELEEVNYGNVLIYRFQILKLRWKYWCVWLSTVPIIYYMIVAIESMYSCGSLCPHSSWWK